MNLLTEFDEEEVRRIWHKDGFAEGKNEGRSEKAIENAKTMLADNLSTDKVSLYSGFTLEQVLELQKQITVQA